MIILLAAAMCLIACNDDITEGMATGQLENEITFNVDYTEPMSDNHRVIYELNLYDFTQEGTLKAAENNLNLLDKLGVDIVWLMPIFDRGDKGKIGSLGSPYAVKDYKSVNPDFGSLEDLKSFVAKAHTLGMKVWLDWVPNHTAQDAVWIQANPEFYVRDAEGNFTNPSSGSIVYSDVYQLDYSNNNLQQTMIEAMKYWQDTADIDGFRCDMVSSRAIPAEFWSKAIAQLKEHKSGTEILGEGDFNNLSEQRLLVCGFDFDYAWDFNTRLKTVGVTAQGITLRDDCKVLCADLKFDNMDRMVYLTNHDDAETGNYYLDVMGDNVYPITVVEFTLYGMPLIYNGQEIGYKPKMSLYEREPIDWNASDAKMQNTIRTLVALKHTQPALANGTKPERGTVKFLDSSLGRVMAFERVKDGNEVLVLVNLGKAGQVIISGITDGNYIKYLDSSTIATGISATSVHLYNETTFDLDDHGYAVYVLDK